VTRILAVADEVDEALYGERVTKLGPDLVVACGDLPFDYLEYLVTMTNVPLVYVLGNHDPDVSPKPEGFGPTDFTSPFARPGSRGGDLGPAGCVNVDGRIADVAGLRVCGLGGSMRYKPGPHQYTQSEMRTRALKLELKTRLKQTFDHRPVDLLVTHSPPQGVGDAEDSPHRGFTSFHRLVNKFSPRALIHGHVHPYGRIIPERTLGSTRVVNVVGHRLLDLDGSSGEDTIKEEIAT
jgi:Calcineurin-like phosphoesterase